jgi:hypothetical protein
VFNPNAQVMQQPNLPAMMQNPSYAQQMPQQPAMGGQIDFSALLGGRMIQ